MFDVLCLFMLVYAYLCSFIGWRCSFVWGYFVYRELLNHAPTSLQARFFLLFSPQKGGRKTTHCKLTKRTVQSAVVVAIKLTKSRIFGCLVSENTGETLLSTYKKSLFGWFVGAKGQKGALLCLIGA